MSLEHEESGLTTSTLKSKVGTENTKPNQDQYCNLCKRCLNTIYRGVLNEVLNWILPYIAYQYRGILSFCQYEKLPKYSQ